MKRYCKISRTAMVGGGLSYRVYIPIKYLPENAKPHEYITTLHNGKPYVTMSWWKSVEYFNMACGWDKLEKFEQEEKAAIEYFRPILNRAFPETKNIPANINPFVLWFHNLPTEETHAEKRMGF